MPKRSRRATEPTTIEEWAAQKRAREALEAMSPEERLAHKRAQYAAYQRAHRAKMGKEQRAARRVKDDARCYDWARIEPNVDKRPDGCWVWTGSYMLMYGTDVYPRVRAGAYGSARADVVVWSLTHKKPLPHGCFLVRTCGNLSCVAEAHSLVSNQMVERAKRRLHEQEELAGREQPRDGRRGSGVQSPQRGRRTAAG
jgi:hypothetical protein